ncbi:MAG TPA: VOC family protein [Solirubrobacteraceae bacterium]|jgi:predicted enzyme related to lactoylglutathione lyase|nr:VOC family protein [Solirubrobacteraceae bacterium]
MTPISTEQLISGVDFVALPTHDVAKSAAFYGDVLGLRRSVYMPERNFAEFETGNLTLSIIDAEKMGLEHHAQKTEVALHVDDVEAARKSLEELGVTFKGDTFDTGVCHMAFFEDPEGNRLMLHHRYTPRVTED